MNPHKLKLPRGFIKSIETIKRLDKEGRLYYMENTSNYYFLEKYVNLLATPGCSTFVKEDSNGDYLFGRNYDFVHYKNNDKKNEMTALNIVVHNKNWGAKYESIGVADGFWLDNAKGRLFAGSLDDGVTDISSLALLPFLCMDGMNSKGLAVSIMHLPTENEWNAIEYKSYDSLNEEEKKKCIHLEQKGEEPPRLNYTVKSGFIAINDADKKAWSVNKNLSVKQNVKGRKMMFHPILMRRMLDYCKNVDEAIKLAQKTNVHSPLPDNDYHILVSDRRGQSVLLEWVHNELKVTPTTHSTNYYYAREDHYGYGHDRDTLIKAAVEDSNFNEEKAKNILETVSQDFRHNKYKGFTLWTSLYNLNQGELKLWSYLDYTQDYKFNIKVK